MSRDEKALRAPGFYERPSWSMAIDNRIIILSVAYGTAMCTSYQLLNLKSNVCWVEDKTGVIERAHRNNTWVWA